MAAEERGGREREMEGGRLGKEGRKKETVLALTSGSAVESDSILRPVLAQLARSSLKAPAGSRLALWG